MELTPAARNDQVNALAKQLAGGSLVLFEGTPTRSFPTVLVTVPLADPAFMGAVNGEAIGFPVPPVTAEGSGRIGFAKFLDANGIALMSATVDTDPAADVVVDYLDVRRDRDEVAFGVITLRVPSGQ